MTKGKGKVKDVEQGVTCIQAYVSWQLCHLGQIRFVYRLFVLLICVSMMKHKPFGLPFFRGAGRAGFSGGGVGGGGAAGSRAAGEADQSEFPQETPSKEAGGGM